MFCLIFSASASHSLLALGFFSDLTDIINVQGSKLNHVESFSLYLSIFLLLIFKADADLLVQLFSFFFLPLVFCERFVLVYVKGQSLN